MAAIILGTVCSSFALLSGRMPQQAQEARQANDNALSPTQLCKERREPKG